MKKKKNMFFLSEGNYNGEGLIQKSLLRLAALCSMCLFIQKVVIVNYGQTIGGLIFFFFL